jgi:hypothetical protein
MARIAASGVYVGMRHSLAPEFPVRRPARPPLGLPLTAFVMILVMLALIGVVISLVVLAPLAPQA